MSMQATRAATTNTGQRIVAAPERRLHKRYPLKLVGRFMRADRHEFACQLIDISVGGIAVSSPVIPELGESIIVYIDELGGLEGVVARTFDGGFALTLKATRHRREKLAARIIWLLNRHEISDAEMRAHDRTPPGRNSNTLKLSEDVTLQVHVIDVSASGANIATEARPQIGAEVLLGKLPARVVRHHDRGIGVRFVEVQDLDTLSSTFS